jgi:hypothetical protein
MPTIYNKHSRQPKVSQAVAIIFHILLPNFVENIYSQKYGCEFDTSRKQQNNCTTGGLNCPVSENPKGK